MLTANKSLHFYIGRLGSGKTHLAKQYTESLNRTYNLDAVFIDVSTVMKSFVGSNATREQLQDFKNLMKEEPRFLVDELHRLINSVPNKEFVITGLREPWIYKELSKTYKVRQVVFVDAKPHLRRQRRKLAQDVFEQQEAKDKSLGIDELIELVSSVATVIGNDFEEQISSLSD